MLHLFAVLSGSAFAGMGPATLDAPVPSVADLDLLPESGAWPCALTLQVDGVGAVTDVTIAPGCPSGLVDTARALGQAWRWEPSAAPHAESVTLVFKVLGREDVEPKAESTRDRMVYLLRPLDLLVGAEPPAWKGKAPSPKLPKAAAAAGITAGTCLLRLDMAPDGTVARARATRCVDALAEGAVAAVKKLKLDVVEGVAPPAEIDVPVRFEAQK